MVGFFCVAFNDNLSIDEIYVQIHREQLTIEGVRFDNLEILERTASAIGSKMFEGFTPLLQKQSKSFVIIV